MGTVSEILMKFIMKVFFLLTAILILNFSCTTTSNMSATINIQDVKILINPHVLYKNGDFYLVYQIALDEQKANVRLEIGEKIKNNKFYYFFIGKSSFQEYDHMVLRPVSKDENIV